MNGSPVAARPDDLLHPGNNESEREPETIWTIGHSTRTLAEFIEAPHAQEIGTAADVRKLPGSRRFPHFDQDALQPELARAGIAYQHFPDLGGRRKLSPASANIAWRHPAFRAYADSMETPAFAEAIGRLTCLALERRTAIMCAEAVWWRCHRGLIADYLKVRGWRVLHILDPQKVQEHPFTSAARIIAGELCYRQIR
jgi:uncharacterized protein (DUF488 family)